MLGQHCNPEPEFGDSIHPKISYAWLARHLCTYDKDGLQQEAVEEENKGRQLVLCLRWLQRMVLTPDTRGSCGP